MKKLLLGALGLATIVVIIGLLQLLPGSPSVLAHGVAPVPVTIARQEPDRFVSVTGTAAIRVLPDTVVWHITIADANPKLLEAKAASDRKMEAILAARDKLKITPEDMQICQVQIAKEFDQPGNGRQPVFRNYKVTRNVTVRQSDMKRFDEYLTGLVGAAEVELNFSLDLSNIRQMQEQTRLEALKVAKAKAGVECQQTGGKLGKIRTITESGPAPARQMYGAVNVDRGGGADVMAGTFAPSAIEVRSTIHTTFDID